MEPRLYIGNLSYNAKEEELKNLFAQFGTVQSVSIITDKMTGRSKGFAFVEMSTADEAQKAISLNGTDFMGRNMTVAEARPKEPRREGRSGSSERRFRNE